MRKRLLFLAVGVLFAVTMLNAQTTTPTYPPSQGGVSQPAQAAQPAQPMANPAAPASGTQIPAGTQLQIRTNQAITATQADVGQQYSAEIADNVLDANGNIIVPKGSQAELTVAKVGTTTAGVGSNQVALALQSINVGGRTYQVTSNQVTQSGNRGIGANKRTAEMTGGGALLGTVIGAIAGGGKGAAIGAAVGGAGGAAAQVATRGNQVKVPAETLLTFKLDQPVALQ
jgi:hypothetical protein